MTVGELIIELQKFSPTEEVAIAGDDSEYGVEAVELIDKQYRSRLTGTMQHSRAVVIR